MKNEADKKVEERLDRVELFVDFALGAIFAALGLIAVLFACSLF